MLRKDKLVLGVVQCEIVRGFRNPIYEEARLYCPPGNISHLGKRKVIFKECRLVGDILVPRRVIGFEQVFGC